MISLYVETDVVAIPQFNVAKPGDGARNRTAHSLGLRTACARMKAALIEVMHSAFAWKRGGEQYNWRVLREIVDQCCRAFGWDVLADFKALH